MKSGRYKSNSRMIVIEQDQFCHHTAIENIKKLIYGTVEVFKKLFIDYPKLDDIFPL